ncbi:MAG: methyltransferase [Gammaproteobacteria bacterium]|nr:methyltransferase [Gammaproteobacteria bacterium]
MLRLKCVAGIAALALLGACGAGSSGESVSSEPADYVLAAIASPERSDEMRARDAARKPAEILALSGVAPGDRVIEIAGFGHYYTTMLSDIVGDGGEVHMFDLPYTADFVGDAPREFVASHPNTEYHLVDYNDAVFPSETDVVFNILYYHDLGPQQVDTAAMNAKLFDALKPGGRYLIVDHKAEDGSGWRDAGTIHRIGAETIIEEVTAAGFELVVDSDLLANPEDDRTAMVFAPGTRGATDRAVLVFRKPG